MLKTKQSIFFQSMELIGLQSMLSFLQVGQDSIYYFMQKV